MRRCARPSNDRFPPKQRRSEVAAEGWRPSLTAARRFRTRPLTRDVGTHCVHLHCSAARAEKQTLLPVVAKTDSFVLIILLKKPCDAIEAPGRAGRFCAEFPAPVQKEGLAWMSRRPPRRCRNEPASSCRQP